MVERILPLSFIGTANIRASIIRESRRWGSSIDLSKLAGWLRANFWGAKSLMNSGIEMAPWRLTLAIPWLYKEIYLEMWHGNTRSEKGPRRTSRQLFLNLTLINFVSKYIYQVERRFFAPENGEYLRFAFDELIETKSLDKCIARANSLQIFYTRARDVGNNNPGAFVIENCVSIWISFSWALFSRCEWDRS